MHDVIREILIDAEPETVFPFLIDGDKHIEWCGTTAQIDTRPGGAHLVLVAGQHQASGEYLEVVPNEKVVYTFGWDMPGNPITPGSTRIEITLHPEGTKTRLRFAHTGLPDEQAVADHGGGWDTYLDRLATVAAGGTVPVDAPA